MPIFWNTPSIYTLSHMTAGVLTALATLVSPVLPAVLFGGFMIYELNEDWHITDQAFKDILEYCYGLFGTVLVLVPGAALVRLALAVSGVIG